MASDFVQLMQLGKARCKDKVSPTTHPEPKQQAELPGEKGKGCGFPRSPSYSYLIQEAIAQRQIGGRVGGKDGSRLLGTSHCQAPTWVVL